MKNKLTMPKQWRLGGKIKYLTKNCNSINCDYYRKLENNEYCSRGEYYKILIYPKNNTKKCSVKDRLTNLEGIITKKE